MVREAAQVTFDQWMTRSNKSAFLCNPCRASRPGCVGRFILVAGEGCPYPVELSPMRALGVPNLEPALPDDLRFRTASLRGQSVTRDPVSGPSYMQKRLDYLDYVAAAPRPSIVVIQDKEAVLRVMIDVFEQALHPRKFL
jgi:hypothetical protein